MDIWIVSNECTMDVHEECPYILEVTENNVRLICGCECHDDDAEWTMLK